MSKKWAAGMPVPKSLSWASYLEFTYRWSGKKQKFQLVDVQPAKVVWEREDFRQK